MKIVGINLSATENHATGVAQLEDNKIRTFSVYKNKDIMEIVERFKPEIVVFDTPLNLTKEPYRCAEKEMVSFGYNPDPQNLGDIKMKIKRAISLKTKISGSKVLETHIDSVKKSLKINKIDELQNVRVMNIMKNEFEESAVFAAVTGLFYSENLFNKFGDDEGQVIIPKIN